MKVKNNPMATMPAINRHQNTLIAIDAIFTRLRLSLLLTQIIERTKPATTQAILTPAQTVLTPSGSVTLRNTGMRVTSGRMLITSDTLLKVFIFLTSIIIYLISFFPNFITAAANTNAKTSTATGRKGKSINAGELLDSAVKSCREQDTR